MMVLQDLIKALKRMKVETGSLVCLGCAYEHNCGVHWTIVNKKDTIFKYIFWERLDSLPIPECCFHFIWC